MRPSEGAAQDAVELLAEGPTHEEALTQLRSQVPPGWRLLRVLVDGDGDGDR